MLHFKSIRCDVSLVCLLLALVPLGCSEESDAPAIWDLTNDELHRIHIDVAFANGALPETVSSYDCAMGGHVEMTVAYDGEPAFMTLDRLDHTYVDCQIDGTVINGRLDYFEVSFCENGAPSFLIDGEVTLTGNLTADCVIEGSEVCGKVTGTVCGEKGQ